MEGTHTHTRLTWKDWMKKSKNAWKNWFAKLKRKWTNLTPKRLYEEVNSYPNAGELGSIGTGRERHEGTASNHKRERAGRERHNDLAFNHLELQMILNLKKKRIADIRSKVIWERLIEKYHTLERQVMEEILNGCQSWMIAEVIHGVISLFFEKENQELLVVHRDLSRIWRAKESIPSWWCMMMVEKREISKLKYEDEDEDLYQVYGIRWM